MAELEITRERHGGRTAIRLVAEGADEGASGLSVVHMKMQIGSAAVRVGGIAGVHTGRRHRGRGYARRVMEDANAFMLENRWEMGLLWGIQDFYPKFGYTVVIPIHSFTMATRDAERARLRHRARRMKRAEIPAVLRIYRRANRFRTGVRLRDARSWEGPRKGSVWGRRAHVTVLTRKGGRIEGYMVMDDGGEAARVAEVGALSRECLESVIALAARGAVERRCGEVYFAVPLDHPLFEMAGRFGATGTIKRRRCGGGMGRIIDQARLFETLRPEFSRRLAAGPSSKWRGTVSVTTELGESVLSVAGGGVSAARRGRRGGVALRLTQASLAQLVTGYRSVTGVLDDEGASASGRGSVDILDRLFPRHEAHMWPPDYF